MQKIVPRNSGEWVRSIGRARLTTFRRYLPVLLDLETQTFVGLPRGWESALGSHIVEVGLRWADENGETDSGDYPWLADQVHSTSAGREKETTAVSVVDILENAVSHDGVLEQVLDAAEAHVFIASPTMSVEVLAELKEPLQRTLQRGLRMLHLRRRWGWQPVLVAGWPPVALLLAVELLAHRPRPRHWFEPDEAGTKSVAASQLSDPQQVAGSDLLAAATRVDEDHWSRWGEACFSGDGEEGVAYRCCEGEGAYQGRSGHESACACRRFGVQCGRVTATR